MKLKCGCIFDGGRFVKYCREHVLMVLKKRAERADFPPKRGCKEGQ